MPVVKKETGETVQQEVVSPKTTAAPALTDDTVIEVKSLVSHITYACSTTNEEFFWVDVGDIQEMTYRQLRIMKTKHPRYFTDKWLYPCNDMVIKKLHLENVFRGKLSRGEMRKFYGTDVGTVESLLSNMNDAAKSELASKAVKDVKGGQIANAKIIRLLEKYLGLDLMQYI